MGRRLGGSGVAATLTRRLLWPALTTAVMLAVALGLGAWQLQRLTWKRGLLAEIDRGEAMAPIPLPLAPEPFRKVVAQGRFLPGVVRYGAEVRAVAAGPVMGAHLVSPLERAVGPAVLIDRGWAPLDFPPEPPSGVVQVEGYIRPPEHVGQPGVSDDAAGRRFFTLDPAAIGLALGLRDVAPYTLVALGRPGALPEPAQALPRPPNDHLSYAVTWFGLAGALVVVFLAYVRQSMKRGGARDGRL